MNKSKKAKNFFNTCKKCNEQINDWVLFLCKELLPHNPSGYDYRMYTHYLSLNVYCDIHIEWDGIPVTISIFPRANANSVCWVRFPLAGISEDEINNPDNTEIAKKQIYVVNREDPQPLIDWLNIRASEFDRSCLDPNSKSEEK